MDSNNGSSATVSITFNGKWAALVSSLLLMVSAAVYKCVRSRTNVQAEVEAEAELGYITTRGIAIYLSYINEDRRLYITTRGIAIYLSYINEDQRQVVFWYLTEGVHVGDTPRHSSNTAGAVHSQGSGMIFDAFVLGTIAIPPPHISGTVGQYVDNLDFLTHKKQDKFLTFWLLSTVTGDVLVHLTTAKTSFDIWSIIERKFGAKSSISLSNMRHTLYSIKKARLTVKEHLARVKTLSDCLITVGSMVIEQKQVSIILAGLPLEYESVRVVASATSVSFDLLTEMLLDCEARQLALLVDVSLQANLASYQKQDSSERSKHTSYSNHSKPGHRGQARGWSRGRNRGGGRNWTRTKPQGQLSGKVGHIVQTCYLRFDENFSGVESDHSMSVNYHQFND
ncbi:hypothetical protein J1N35_013440 [Gossypium stocksii]|uniref:Uncharacterized protein n=1 Tax=Gossypium stocksii TaxID=47602 RepID=A0A9D3VU35_9ROSI|nr:hypothetical protein J1N35_013440 [Gossypium stocksii]